MNSTDIITVSLGKPVTIPCLIPVEHKSTPSCIDTPIMINGECYKITAISLGSPLGAIFTDNLNELDIQKTGPCIETHYIFPKGASIVFIQIIDSNTLEARLWQQGKGEIAFTREAVCVAGVSAMMLHKILTDRATVRMGENIFQVDWNRATGEVSLTGPADLLEN